MAARVLHSPVAPQRQPLSLHSKAMPRKGAKALRIVNVTWCLALHAAPVERRRETGLPCGNPPPLGRQVMQPRRALLPVNQGGASEGAACAAI
jgi:hypothetical protein